jgi:type IV secretion system protein VirB5
MKKVYYVYVALIGLACPIAGSSQAWAQGIPVHDNANLLQQIQAVRQALQVVAQGKQQIAEAQKLYQDLNKLTDIPRLAQQLKTDALRELDTSGGSLQGFGTGNLDDVGAGRAKAGAVTLLTASVLDFATRQSQNSKLRGARRGNKGIFGTSQESC